LHEESLEDSRRQAKLAEAFMRLCSYTMTFDTGFAPNPFFRYCTVAVCTPNHLGIQLEPGDWILGHTTAAQGHRLVYAMEVSEILCFDQYHNDPRFEKKKPRFGGNWREACGDNIYCKGIRGAWKQGPSLFHYDSEERAKDIRHHVVFIGKRFYYFGRNAKEIEKPFIQLIRNGRGCKCSHPPDLVRDFLAWLQKNFTPGIHGDPRDLDLVNDLLTRRAKARHARDGC
jgi:hypothetical protein